MKLSVKRKRVLPPPSPPARSTPSKKKGASSVPDPARQRGVQDLQAETHRWLSAIDQKRKYATVKGLGQACDLLRAMYTVFDLCEEEK